MVCVLVLTDKENVPIGRSSWIFLFARIRAGYECSYWAHVAHTLCSILPHVKNRALVVGASTSAFGCHPPNGVCVGKLWTMRKRWLYIQTTMLLSFTFKAFVVARMGKEFILNSLSVMEICTLSDRIPFWSKIYIFTAWCVRLVLCQACTRLLVRNGLVNEFKFLGLIPQKTNEIARLVIIM